MDETRIDTLTIEIGASSDKAVREIGKVEKSLKSLQAKSQQSVVTPKVSGVEEATRKTGKLAGIIKKTSAWTKERFKIKVDATDAEKASKKVGLLTRTLNALKRIAFYRLIRTAIKEIGEAFREGQENAYWYSKTVGEQTKYISEAYDNLSSASFQMKNQLGASWATLKATVTPILLEIVRLVTLAANAITQFFAVLSGKSTYMRAIDYTKDWAEQTEGGAKAAKEWKKQLLGFDVINRLEEPSSGGGGASNPLADYENMFEETEISEWAEKIKPVLEWIKNHMELIKALALAIGAALALWKIGEIIGKISNLSDLMKTLLGLAVAVGGAIIYVQGFIDAWNNGPDWANLAKMIGGVALAALGLGLAFGPIAAGIALVVGGLGMLVVGLKDWITTGELSTETFWTLAAGIAAVSVGLGLITGSAGIGLLVGGIGALTVALADWITMGELSTKTFWLMEAGIAAVGVGLSLMTGSWIPAAIAVVAGLGLAIYQHWDEIKAFTKETWEKVKTFIQESWDKIKEAIKNAWENIKQTFSEIKEKARMFVTQTLPDFFNKAIEWFKSLPEKIGYWLGFAFGKITAWGENALKWVKEEVPKIIDKIVGFFQELPGKIGEKLDEFRSTLTQWVSSAKEWVSENVPNIINSIVDWFNNLPDALVTIGKNMITGLWNGILSAGDWLWRQVSGFFGGLWDSVSGFFSGFGSGYSAGYSSVPKFAVGGFPEDGLFFANHHELVGQFSNGRTAVANNEQIVDGISDGVYNAVLAAMGNNDDRPVSVRVYLDSREIKTGQQRLARVTGG